MTVIDLDYDKNSPYPFYEKEMEKEAKDIITMMLHAAASVLPKMKWFEVDWGYEREVKIESFPFTINIIKNNHSIFVWVKSTTYRIVWVKYNEEINEWEGFITEGLENVMSEIENKIWGI